MPRRVYTYPEGLGWDGLNLVSTAGALLLAGGVAVFLFDLARNLRPSIAGGSGNVWNAGTLDWLPNELHGLRSIPRVNSRDPLWDQPSLPDDVEAGRYYLPGTVTGRRETIVISPIEAEPQYLLRLPGPGWGHFLAAILTAAFFLLLTVKAVVPAVLCGLGAAVAVLVWMRESDPAPLPPVDIGGSIRVPTYVSGPASHAWWAMVVLLLVAGSLYLSYVFSYLYLWTVYPDLWPGEGARPGAGAALLSGALLLSGSGLVATAGRAIRRGRGAILFGALLGAALLAGAASLSLELVGHWRTGLRPAASGYGALVYLASFLQAQLLLPLVIMAGFALARRLVGRLDAVRRNVFDSFALLWHYFVAQGLLGLLLVHGFPRLI
jgi:cytochrome c oxidase subunit I+III